MTAKAGLTPELILGELGQPPARMIVPVTGGADTQIWRVALPGGDVAMRLMRAEQQAAAIRERAAMDAARLAGLPAPGVHVAGEVAGRPVFVLEWLPGVMLRRALEEAPWRTWRLAFAFGQMQARIHQLPSPAEVMQAKRSWIDWAAPDSELAALLHRRSSPHAMLLHLDYHPSNVLAQDGAISAVLDWTNANGGDPRADVARTGAILRFLPGNPAWAPERDANVRRLLLRGWRCGYQSLAGPLAGMAAFHAWAGALMQRELTPRLGRADLPWLTEAWLARVQRWTAMWRGHAVQAH